MRTEWCWLKDGCPSKSGACLGETPTDDGCPIYRWFRDMFVKHGRWIDECCSECGKYVYAGDADDYCPHCGAKMDGEAENEAAKDKADDYIIVTNNKKEKYPIWS